MRVLSLNIQLLPPLVHTTGGPSYKDERLRYFVERVLPDYDVVCLSEAWTCWICGCVPITAGPLGRCEQLVCAARERGFPHAVRAPRPPSCKLLDSGLLVLSRLPISASAQLSFTHPGCGVERVVTNGALYARVNGVALFVAHLQSDQVTRRRVRGSGANARAHQVAELRRFIRRHAPGAGTADSEAEGPTLLLGDLNIDTYALERGDAREQAEWTALLEALDGIDVLKVHSAGSVREPTLGDADESGQPTQASLPLTATDDLGSRQVVDHIVRIGGKGMAKGKRRLRAGAALDEDWVRRARVVKLLAPDQPFAQVSDHYGVMVELRAEAARASRLST